MVDDIVRVTIGGTLGPGEIWSVNPHYQVTINTAAITPLELNAAAAAILLKDPGTLLLGMLSTIGTITRCRVEARNYAGELQAVGEATKTTPWAGSNSPNMPLQVSACASLRTPFAGASNRGRLYWPHLQGSLVATTARISTAQAGAFATAMASYLEDVHDALVASIPGKGTFPLVVYSGTKAHANQVTSIQAGDVLDTQRRRRDSLLETYGQSVYPPG